MKNGTDEIYAKKVAAHINSIHTHFEVNEEDFLRALPDIVYTIESHDITYSSGLHGPISFSSKNCRKSKI